jgi:hypothetical protein
MRRGLTSPLAPKKSTLLIRPPHQRGAVAKCDPAAGAAQRGELWTHYPRLTDNANDYLGRVDFQWNSRNTMFNRCENTHRRRIRPGYFGDSIANGNQRLCVGQSVDVCRGRRSWLDLHDHAEADERVSLRMVPRLKTHLKQRSLSLTYLTDKYRLLRSAVLRHMLSVRWGMKKRGAAADQIASKYDRTASAILTLMQLERR